MIKELIQTAILALGSYKLFEILVKWCESFEEKYIQRLVYKVNRELIVRKINKFY